MVIGKCYIEGVKNRKLKFKGFIYIYDNDKENKQPDKVRNRIIANLYKKGFDIRISEVYDNE